MRIVITGSSGFIGRHLVEACEDRWPNAQIIQVDIPNDCREFFLSDAVGADLTFHCAAITGGIEGTTGNPTFLAAHNAQLDGACFEWALRTRSRLVYFSSSCAYPMFGWDNPARRLLSEDHLNYECIETHPDNTYGWVKLMGEVIAHSLRSEGVPVSIVRPFAVYGSDQELCRMIPAFVRRALLDTSEKFEVWGTGQQASDFIHIDDTVGAIFAMLDDGFSGPLNLCTGIGTSADDAANLVMEAVGIPRREIVHRLDKPSGPLWRVGDPTMLEEIYVPKITLAEGIARAIEDNR